MATTVNDALTSSLHSWNQGQQQAAVDTIRPHADGGDRASVLLMAWYLSQMGQPFWNEGLTYAHKAIEMGIPQVASYYFGNLIGDPSFRPRLPDLVREAVAAGWPLDALPNVAGTVPTDPATAVALVTASAEPRPYPDAWKGQLAEAKADFDALKAGAGDVATERDAALERIESIEAALTQRQTEVEQRAESLIGLIDQLTAAQETSYFDKEATKHGTEAKWLWLLGLGVLFAAALLALTPLANYYYDRFQDQTPWLQGRELLAAHTTAAIALAALAGVLLARARGRDRSSQRARNLTVALQTMFVYAEQIKDVEQRQHFISEMGRVVVGASLRHDASATDADRSLLGAIRTH